MQRLMADPMVMIVGASPSLRSHMHQLVEQMGFRYVEASSVDDVFNTLRNATPVEAIFILDHLRDLDLGQLVQRIRINPSTSTVPIALLADSLSSLEHSVANSDPGVIVGSVPPSIDGFGFEDVGLDRRLSWGTLLEGRNIQIAEEGQGQGPGDGSCCHDQIVRSGARGSQSGALFDPESVLFVDHDDA